MQAATYNHYLLMKESAMADPQLPSEFEVIVIGTGVEESIIAAACARNGHSVLHLDPEGHYGSNWASFSFDGIQNWIKGQTGDLEAEPKPEEANENVPEFKPSEGEELLPLKSSKGQFYNITETWHCPDKPAPEQDEVKSEDQGEKEAASGKEQQPKWTKEKILSSSRSFNIDIVPRLLFSRGSMVELLISSNISRYTEFKSVSRVLTRLPDGRLEDVPSSRSDVFATKAVSIIEKRILIKFLSFCVNFQDDPERYQGFEEKTFREFLLKEKLTNNLISYVMSSIAMVDASKATTMEGLKATRKFLQSLGRFGHTPFLWPMYGAGELPQAFCRLCAVFGGTYYLGRSIQGLVVDKEDGSTVKAVVSEGQRLSVTKALVLGAAVTPDKLLGLVSTSEVTLDRQITLRSDSILPAQKEQLTFICLPPAKASSAEGDGGDLDLKSQVFYQEVGNGAAACPKEMYCLQASRALFKGHKALDDLNQLLRPEDDGKALWTLRYQMTCTEVTLPSENEEQKSNVRVCSDPRFELDYDKAIESARSTFESIFPGEDFLPRAPEPEEIVLPGCEEPGKSNSEDQNNPENQANPNDEKDLAPPEAKEPENVNDD